jgi:predicted glycoside hydrolase/deacetylase ChbG (UPF0249 family)
MTSPRILQLCADDFGLSDGVDLAVLDLIRRGRLSATSCMMAGQSLVAHAHELSALRGRADIGLHITLTDLAPLGAMPKFAPGGRPPALNRVMLLALTGQLDGAEISAEIARQIERFTSIFGGPPDFVDGHQHVHVLPVIRRALFDQFRNGTLPPTTAIRNCAEPVTRIIQRGIEVPKALLISLLSAGIGRTAARLGVPTNDSFRGVTAFAIDQPFGPTFRRFLAGDGMRPLAMCHPALPGFASDPTDVIPVARTLEYAYFASDEFIDDLTAADITIARHPRGECP